MRVEEQDSGDTPDVTVSVWTNSDAAFTHLGIQSEEFSVGSLADGREPLVVFRLVVKLAGSLSANLQYSFPQRLCYCNVAAELQTLKNKTVTEGWTWQECHSPRIR